jgi:hypothetical protein
MFLYTTPIVKTIYSIFSILADRYPHQTDEGSGCAFFYWSYFMSIQCPLCRSHQVITLDHGKKVGGLIGTVGGAASGVAGALTGAEFGGTLGLIAGPAGSALGSLAGAIFGGLIGAATGGVAGSKLGEVVDQRVLDNCVCQTCGLTFSERIDDRIA